MDTRSVRRAVATAGVLLAVTAVAAEKRGEPFALVSMDEVERLVGRADVFIVDANPKEVFQKNRLPGARWYRSQPFAELLPAEKDRTLVFYCASPT